MAYPIVDLQHPFLDNANPDYIAPGGAPLLATDNSGEGGDITNATVDEIFTWQLIVVSKC